MLHATIPEPNKLTPINIKMKKKKKGDGRTNFASKSMKDEQGGLDDREIELRFLRFLCAGPH